MESAFERWKLYFIWIFCRCDVFTNFPI